MLPVHFAVGDYRADRHRLEGRQQDGHRTHLGERRSRLGVNRPGKMLCDRRPLVLASAWAGWRGAVRATGSRSVTTRTAAQSGGTNANGSRCSEKRSSSGCVILLFKLILLLGSSELRLRIGYHGACILITGLTRLNGHSVVLLRGGYRVRGRLRRASAKGRQRHNKRHTAMGSHRHLHDLSSETRLHRLPSDCH